MALVVMIWLSATWLTIWSGRDGDDLIRGDHSPSLSLEGGSDMLYGGPGNDFLHGQAATRALRRHRQRQIWEMKAMTCCGVVSVKTSLKVMTSSNNRGRDSFVLAAGEGIIMDFEVGWTY